MGFCVLCFILYSLYGCASCYITKVLDLGSSLVSQELLPLSVIWQMEWPHCGNEMPFMSVLDVSLTPPLRIIWFPFAFSIILQSCDLWSLGVIIYVMLCGYPPFYSKHHSRTIPKDMRKKIMTGSFDFPEDEWSQISEMAKDIVRKWGLFLLSCRSLSMLSAES